ncbi:hypothetical protein Q5752_004512 [Cryptotrichosporon argae]
MRSDADTRPRRASLTDKLKGEYMEIIGKVTNNPGKAASGGALKSGQTAILHPSTSAPPAASSSSTSPSPLPSSLSPTRLLGKAHHAASVPDTTPPEGMAGGPREPKLEALRGPCMDETMRDGLGSQDVPVAGAGTRLAPG